MGIGDTILLEFDDRCGFIMHRPEYEPFDKVAGVFFEDYLVFMYVGSAYSDAAVEKILEGVVLAENKEDAHIDYPSTYADFVGMSMPEDDVAAFWEEFCSSES